MTNTTGGAPIWTWPWTQNPFGEKPASGSGYTLNLRYPGQYYDQETGLMYNMMRDYESGTGRYIQVDPRGLGGGIDTYAYVQSSPLNHSDRWGMQELGGSQLNNALQDTPSTWCDLWPASCLFLCVEATCTYHDCGRTWVVRETEWMNAQGAEAFPTPDEVKKLDKNCVCTRRKIYP